MPYVVSDEAFALSNFLLTLYGGKHLPEKENFQVSPKNAQRYVECTSVK